MSSKQKGTGDAELDHVAASVLMKIFYAARVARWDLLRAIGYLATRITKWTRFDDLRLHRLVSYVHLTYGLRMRSWLKQSTFADADFAGDLKDSKSTSGGYLCILAPGTHVQLGATSKKQTAVGHSIPEAEIVSADYVTRTDMFPMKDLLETVLKRKIHARLHEDNQTASLTIKKGKSQAMRHVLRTHRVSIQWLHDMCERGEFDVYDCPTHLQRADIFTKHFTDRDKWEGRLIEIGHWFPGKASLHKATSLVEKPKKPETRKPDQALVSNSTPVHPSNGSSPVYSEKFLS